MHVLSDQQHTTPAARQPIRVAVDLSHLRPGGENGDIKPLLFETLLWPEVLDADKLNPADARMHGVHLLAADVQLANGRECSLFSNR